VWAPDTVSTMPASNTPGAPSPFPTVANFRDLGHWAGDGGRVVAPGALYRANDFATLDDDDRAGLSGLGLRTVIDLRTEVERNGTPDPSFPGATELVLDVLADAGGQALPANLGAVLADPKVAQQMSEQLTPESARTIMTGNYRDFIDLESAQRSFRGFFSHLLGDAPVPTLFHCTTGKDRTGWAAATFLSVLGVDRADVYREYLLTNDRLVPALRPIFDNFAAAGGNPDLLQPLLGVEAQYLDAAFARVDEEFGSLEQYLTEVLDVDAQAREELRARYLVDRA